MKPLEKLINIEKGAIIHQLFPQEMPEFLDYTQSLSEFVQQDEEALRKKWDNPIITVEMWVRLAQYTEETIKKYGKKLHASSRLFTDQLFDGYNSLFLIHCLQVYTTTQKLSNRKFSQAVDLFFNP